MSSLLPEISEEVKRNESLFKKPNQTLSSISSEDDLSSNRESEEKEKAETL